MTPDTSQLYLKLAILLLALLASISGIVILFGQNRWIAAGVFLMIWGNTLHERGKNI